MADSVALCILGKCEFPWNRLNICYMILLLVFGVCLLECTDSQSNCRLIGILGVTYVTLLLWGIGLGLLQFFLYVLRTQGIAWYGPQGPKHMKFVGDIIKGPFGFHRISVIHFNMSQQYRMKSIKILILLIETDLWKTSLGSRRFHVTALSLGSSYITDLFLCNDDTLRPHSSLAAKVTSLNTHSTSHPQSPGELLPPHPYMPRKLGKGVSPHTCTFQCYHTVTSLWDSRHTVFPQMQDKD